MKIEDQYKALLKLRDEINIRLKDLDFEKIKELLLWLAKSEDYCKIRNKENQLIMLDFFCNVWLEEKKQLADIGIEEDIFWNIHSLTDIEQKYLLIKFGILRIENGLSEEICNSTIESFIDNKISGIALGKVIVQETSEKEQNIIKTAELLKNHNQWITSMILLGWAGEYYPKNKEIMLGLADCWMAGRQWNQAIECLKKIEDTDLSIQELITNLESEAANENL